MEQQTTIPLEFEERKVTRTVNVKLTNTDIANLGDEAAKLKAERDTAEADLKKHIEEVTKPLKAEIEQKTAKIENILDNINKREESRTVECIERKIFNANTVQYYFNGDLVEERAMEPGERQGEFPEVKHGELVDGDEGLEARPATDDEQRADIRDVILDERRADKPSLVDMT